MADIVLLNELERAAEIDPVPVGPAVVVVELLIEKGALVVLKLDDPVPRGGAAVVVLPMVNCALLLLELDEDVTGVLEAVGPADAVVLLPMLKRAELELELRRDDVVMPPVEIAAEEVSGSLGNGALLEVICAMGEVVELLAEKMDEDSAVLEAPVPVGPAEEMVVLLPIVKRAELDELRTEEVVMPADAVGPKVLVALPVGNMAVVLELEELKM